MTQIDILPTMSTLPATPLDAIAAPGMGKLDRVAPAAGGIHIRSFVHRRGHITQSQKEALDTLAGKWTLPYQDHHLKVAAAFGREAPTVLEIGFGMGETTAQIAQAQPERNFIGVEVFNAGVGAMLRRIEQAGLRNVRIVQHDAVDVVRNMIAPDSLSGVHVYFPDPWPKKRHHKRRLIQSPFVALLATRIAPGGYLHCATDWQPYAEQMLEVLHAEPLLANTADGFSPRPAWRPQTKFEARGLRLGHGVWDVIFERRPVSRYLPRHGAVAATGGAA
ncbi:tRNA (guanosine(46)-N7)-methyltransferase TrmB [Pigmentiphaga soli]|uniref:tRNA (guanine-N(7)-)-methyltransferase n=1 Tax=Pigmentiphaga soli TaxID=1007095 RepID=A0ABP8GNC7_9BURK